MKKKEESEGSEKRIEKGISLAMICIALLFIVSYVYGSHVINQEEKLTAKEFNAEYCEFSERVPTGKIYICAYNENNTIVEVKKYVEDETYD